LTNFKNDLKETDKTIGYIKEEYFDEYLKRRSLNIEKEFLEDPYTKDIEDTEEFVLFKVF